jgi:hypothetical protein
VAWHEWKTGVYYPQEKSARTAGGRGVMADKRVIRWQGSTELLDFYHASEHLWALGRTSAPPTVAWTPAASVRPDRRFESPHARSGQSG